MLNSLLVLAAARPADVDTSGNSMLKGLVKRYSSNVSMRGTVINAVSDGQGTIVTTTEFSYVKPSKIILVQNVQGKRPESYRIASDGEHFSYDAPMEAASYEKPKQRLSEPVQKNKYARDKNKKLYVQSIYLMTVADIYLAGSHSLADASFVHDMLMGVKDNANAWLNGVETIGAPEPGTLDGAKVTKISGTYKVVRVSEAADLKPDKVGAKSVTPFRREGYVKSVSSPGEFTFYLNPDGTLKRLLTVEVYDVKGKYVKVASVWDVNVTLNPDIPLKAFTAY